MLNFQNITLFTLTVTAVIIVCGITSFCSLYWVFLPVFLWLFLILFFSFSISYNFFINSFSSKQLLNTKKIAITFDDGPHPQYTKSILDLLDKHNAKATFFCIGKQIEKHPELFKEIAKRGHCIGNHTYSHNAFIGFSSKAKWLKEIFKTDSIIKELIGISPKFFRPPFGITTPHLASAIKETKHLVVGWNNRPFDTALKNKNFVLTRIIKHISPGGIILLHDTQLDTFFLLEYLLLYLKENQFEAVTINNLINEN